MFAMFSHLAGWWRRYRVNEPPPDPAPSQITEQAIPSPTNGWDEELASLPDPDDPCADSGHRVIAVGSGKGGVGKTLVSSSLALALAEPRAGSVTAIDVDLGGANLHAGLGIPRPEFALNRFLLDGVPLDHLVATSETEGLRFIGGASDIVGLSELTEDQRDRFLEELQTLPNGTTVLDLGAGSSLFNLDLFCLADQGVLVTTPEPTSIHNAYGFLRASVYRRIRLLFDGEDGLIELLENAMNHRGTDETDSVPGLLHQIYRYNRPAAARLEEVVTASRVGVVVNMSGEKSAKEVAKKLDQIAQKYLGIRVDFLGGVARDAVVHRAVCEWRPLIVHYPTARATRNLRAIATRIEGRLECRKAPPL
jgi:flagellar biosynthesis protein FlhG